jgi:hypothetical protein
LTAFKILQFLHISDLYIWNRVTLQNAEPPPFVEQRSAFLPVEGRPRHVIYHLTSAGRDVMNVSSQSILSAKQHDQTGDYAGRLPVWDAPSGRPPPDGARSVDDDDDGRLKRRSLEYCNRQKSKWSETSDEGWCCSAFGNV